jgi:RNA polymerase sigma factor (sigma-70 family)
MDAGTDDHQLLESFLSSQSQAAFAELVRRHLSLVYYTALRRVGGDSHLAEDVTQSVFLALAKKAAQAKRRPILAGWLYTSTRFAAAQAVRTERRRRNREQHAHEMETLTEPTADWESMGLLLDEALDNLNEKDREMMLLRFFENRPLAEVGARFALSPDAARMRIDRALERLRVNLAKRGVASSAAALTASLMAQGSQPAPLYLLGKVVSGVFGSVTGGATGALGLKALLTASSWKLATAISLVALGTGVAFSLHRAEILSHFHSSSPGPEGAARSSQQGFRGAPTPIAMPSAAPTPRSSSPLASVPSVAARVKRLDALVHLSAAQTAQAQTIFTTETQAIEQFAPGEMRAIHGMEARQKSRAEIRAMLTDAQRTIYNRTPQQDGGGSSIGLAGTAERLDRIVTLTDEQIAQTVAIIQGEAAALAEIPENDLNRRAQIQQAAQLEMRALLTPDQQKKFDADPNSVEDLTVRALATNTVMTSAQVSAQVGAVQRLQFLLAQRRTVRQAASGTAVGQTGYYRIRVEGAAGQAVFKVSWEQLPLTAPPVITGIDADRQ